ncbi:hypothetical protein Tco_0259806 [Tanacetum coccineum]|uniref:Uncharacterized protein n=1 Tax=Tanacetum coccineum TaxID=301880 RepID=A0ABQ5FLZ1_9ASTR
MRRDPNKRLRGWTTMLSVDFPDCEDSRAYKYGHMSFTILRITKKRREKTMPKRHKNPDLGMEKTVKDKAKSKPKSQLVKVKVNPDKSKSQHVME